MTPKSTHSNTGRLGRTFLLVPRSEAEERLRKQIEKGVRLLGMSITYEGEYFEAELEIDKWDKYNLELLNQLIVTDDPKYSYETFRRDTSGLSSESKGFAFYQDMRDRIAQLESIIERLELIAEAPGIGINSPAQATDDSQPDTHVFVVHGHDEEAKQSVARLIEKLGLEVTILHEQPNQGRTIMEKFEEYADAGFAVVLLTPDDIGASKSTPNQFKDRARQNVILELGYFLGRLGRNRVSALHKGNVEFPSDYNGVLWIPLDPGGAWQFKLAQEMRAAGLKVDLNNL